MSRKAREKKKQTIRQKAKDKELKRKEKDRKRLERIDKNIKIKRFYELRQMEFERQCRYIKPTFDKASFQPHDSPRNIKPSVSENTVLDNQRLKETKGFNITAWNNDEG